MISLVIVIVFLAALLILQIVPGGTYLEEESQLGDQWSDTYDEEVFQDYANEQYEKEFGSSSAYEDNLLLVFLTAEDDYDYYYIAWVGDHIATDIRYMLGNEETELGQAMSECINEASYKYSLDSDLAGVFKTLTGEIQTLGLESSYDCDEEHIQVKSHLSNYTDLPMTEETVNDALTAFTEATGIPAVIVVEDMEEVFGGSGVTIMDETPTVEQSSGQSRGVSWLTIGAIVIIAVVAIVTILRNRREKNEFDSDEDDRYKDFDF